MLQLLFGCGFAIFLIVVRALIQKKNPPKSSSPHQSNTQSFRFHYHLGFVLSLGFLTLSLTLLPLVEILGKSSVDVGVRARAFFSLVLSVFFLFLAISYGVKKGDFKWKRPE